MSPYYVYIILCEGNNYYTGYTRNVKSRFRSHMSGKGARYTRIHKPKSVVFIEKFDSRSEAMRRERRIKKLTHLQKTKLTHVYVKNEAQPKKRGKR